MTKRPTTNRSSIRPGIRGSKPASTNRGRSGADGSAGPLIAGSVLIRSGLDVYSVSRQLGHSKPSSTLDKYAAEFEKARNSEAIRDRLQSAFGGQ
jgi:hypothetical protein